MTERMTLSSGTAELACDVTGGGVPLVCLHAGVADRRVWAAVTPRLAERHRVFAYDRRGFGETTYRPEAFSHTTDLAAVIAGTRQRPVVLIGNSQGGRIALDFALEHPEQVRALVLVAPAISGAPPPEGIAPEDAALDAAAEAAWEAGDVAEANRLEARLWLDGPSAEEGRVGGTQRTLFLDMNERVLTAPEPGEELEAPSAWERIEDLALPTLVVCGGLDLSYVVARSELLAARAPDARFVLLEEAAHLPMLEAPDVFADAVTPFLEAS